MSNPVTSYNEYLKELESVIRPSRRRPLTHRILTYRFASGSIGQWIRSLAGVDPQDPTQFVPPIFSPLYRR
jgi:hypothetical protein